MYMYWDFAIVNGRLAEVHFEKSKTGEPKITAHGYVRAGAYTTQKEKAWIKKATIKNRISYHNGKYRRLS